MTTSTRRQFIQSVSVAGAAALAARSARAWNFSSAAQQTAEPLPLFAYSQVQLTEGVLRRQFDENYQRFLGLDEDAMLKPFRQREGLPAPGPDMGGWYDDSDDYNPR